MSIIFINIIYLKLVDIFLKMFIKLLTFLFKKNYCISIIEISITLKYYCYYFKKQKYYFIFNIN